MKKLFVSFLFVIFSGSFLFSQDPMFIKDEKVINLGIGIGSTLYSGSFYTGTVPPVSASFEMGVVDEVIDDKGVIGVGGYVGYSSYKYKYSDWGWRYSNFIIGGRGTFHYPLIDKLDTYTGLLAGVEILSTREFGDPIAGVNVNSANGGLVWSWYVGGRYYFSEKFAAMAELGYGITYLNIGIALKI